MKHTAGTTLLVVILLAWLGGEWSRPLLRRDEAPPAPVVSGGRNRVLLGSGFPRPGVHQIFDGQTIGGVIGLTKRSLAPPLAADPCLALPLSNGAALELLVKGDEIVDIFVLWMPAGQRLALGVPLHPDRMNRDDWEALEGIGPALAEKIERDRQQNGDFGSLDTLQRVRGIGPGRIKAWTGFFR